MRSKGGFSIDTDSWPLGYVLCCCDSRGQDCDGWVEFQDVPDAFLGPMLGPVLGLVLGTVLELVLGIFVFISTQQFKLRSPQK